ncbi:MAG: DUF4874 domain-containing protein [Oscillospiraceae bacterium]|jgi:hypothetical protein|nr:DUF4874 domain-containing protein [Oscillospiraceae bacterium]
MRCFFLRFTSAVVAIYYAVLGFFVWQPVRLPRCDVPQTPAWSGKVLPVLQSKVNCSELTTEFALPMLGLGEARPLLRNPDRGLRMETHITLGVPESYPGNMSDPYEKFQSSVEKYGEESPVITQQYVYLTRYNEKPLDDIAFAQLRQILELARDNGVRVLLRFAYQTESESDPDWPRVEGHLLQLGAWFRENGQLIEDTIYAFQAGLVGYWGEGHTFKNFPEDAIGPAFDLLFKIVPEDMYIQVRNTDLYQTVAKRNSPRLGMHDDYLIGEYSGPWSFFNGQNDWKTELLEKRFVRTINDAELPWGHATYYDRPDGHPLDRLAPLPILAQIKQYSLTTLSLEHNYRESAGRTYSMEGWKEQALSAAQLTEAGLPYHPALLGEDGTISAFAYVQYHLGYLLSIPSFKIKDGSVRFTIQNNGFAAPLNFGTLSLVIGDKEYAINSYDKHDIGSMQAATYSVKLPKSYDGSQRVGIKLSLSPGSSVCARFINNTEFADGVQWMA